MALSEIIQVSIQAGTVSPTRQGFGVPLILAYHSAWATDEVRAYSTFSGVAADFAAGTMPYLMAAALFAQNPRPPVIKIARLPDPPTGQTQVIDITDLIEDSTITGSVVGPDGTATAISVAWNSDLPTTFGDLDTAIDAITGVTTSGVSPTLTVTGDNVGEMWRISFDNTEIKVRDTSEDWDYDDRLDDVLNIDAAFYAVCVDNNSPKNMDKVARWAATNGRLAGFSPQYTDLAQFASGEFTAGADYTALLANDNAFSLFTEDPRSAAKEAAWFGTMLPRDPGSATWAFKQLNAVGADAYTTSERTTIETPATHSGNHYVAEADIPITRPGKTFGGEWIDVVRGLAWLEARIEERLFGLLVNNPKVPYTARGFSQLTAEVRAQLQEGVDRGVLDEGFTVTILPVESQSTADKNNRHAAGLEFQARLAGAVHSAQVIGTVTV